ncbi:DUF4835 family protein [Puteibacter caeruleilacunae]|nr:DUF4835 family protein [Puteibacter caeruleilacunae]
MNKIIVLILFFVIGNVAVAQELRCSVSVSGQGLKGVNQNVFRTMQKDIYEFVNNRKWTNHTYTYDERIECNIYIRITEQLGVDEFKGSVQVQLKRPIFNSSYKSTVLNIKDKDFHVKYVEFQPLNFDENSSKGSLVNIIAYYAYVILGFDYDTYSPEGGTEYFQKAQAIVNRSQSSIEQGWKSFENERNRYWLVENILNKSYRSYRECIYKYHRTGLDLMAEKTEEGRANIAESLRLMQRVFRTRSNLYITRMFFDAKTDELVQIFSRSFPDEVNRVLAVLNEIDPSNSTKYEKIKESNGF